ncbi:leucyl/phenylalanyl-tRNA--protein transferase [Longivirga aurantiaca]|uniref:Leucyl/phenylalanyl-tRNA--protein transferase n=1 Tax=Longivirga aurantiaca TaxID=1837743 RepID=A0ABW1T477_9ACTN
MSREEPAPTGWVLPDPALGEPGEEVLGVGADLEPGTLLAAYRSGLFPMPLDRAGPLGWWSPDPRGVLPLDGLRVTRSLRKSCRRFTTTVDTAFEEVMRACGDPRRPSGWITEQFVQAYVELHRLGWAHSVETRTAEGDLVGGLYGVEIGGLFAGESMFSRERDASKVALVALVDALVAAPGPGRLLDVQWCTDHLATLGVVEVDRLDYLELLDAALALPPAFTAPEGRRSGG